MKLNQLFSRVIAFLLDFSLALWPFHLLISIPRMEIYQKKLDRFFYKNLKSLDISHNFIELISCLAMLFLISQIIRIYTTFFLGRTFGQILVGINNSSSFWWKRLSGCFRLFLETILGPMLFTYAFVLSKNRTLHEILSDSHFKFREGKTLFLRLSVVLLFSLVSCVLSPMALNYSDFHDFQYVKETIKPKKISEESDFSEYNEFGSLTFGFSVFTSLKQSGLFLYPSLEIKKEGRRLLKSPIIYIIDKKTGAIGKLSIEIKFEIKDLIRTADYANPFLRNTFPKLFEKQIDVESEEVTNQFIELLDDIFGLNYQSTPKLIFKLGPILLGPAKFRKQILKFLSNTASVQVQQVKLNKDRFLRLQQLFKKTEFEELPFQDTFIGLERLNGKVIQIKWGRDKVSAQTREKFEEYFLATISLTDAVWDERTFPLENWTSFDIIDGIMKKELAENDRIKLRLEIIRKIDQLIALNKELKSEKIQKMILQSMNRYLFLQNSKSSHLKSSAFRNQLINIKDEILND